MCSFFFRLNNLWWLFKHVSFQTILNLSINEAIKMLLLPLQFPMQFSTKLNPFFSTIDQLVARNEKLDFLKNQMGKKNYEMKTSKWEHMCGLQFYDIAF